MAEYEFTIGVKEKHKVLVRYFRRTGKVTILIDEAEQGKLYHWTRPKTIVLEIGEDEVHKLTVKTKGVVFFHIEAFVDGELIYKD